MIREAASVRVLISQRWGFRVIAIFGHYPYTYLATKTQAPGEYIS